MTTPDARPELPPAARPAVLRIVDRSTLVEEVAALLGAGRRIALVAAHEDDGPSTAGGDFRVVYVMLQPGQAPVELVLTVPRGDAWVPTLSGVSYPGGRFEREIRDLYGIDPVGHPQPRRMVRHGHWPSGHHPMRRDADPHPVFADDIGSYPFVEVEGTGVYEIPVGPIHAGLIEPGHFRFSVVGETILRMKARLWFVHRGVEKLFEGRAPADGIELAERISGDTAVGHTLAYVMAVEQALGIAVPHRALLVRALLLECERLYNHVNDIGAIVNDVGYGIVHAHTQRLREHLLRHNKRLTGHRLLRGGITVGDAALAGAPDLELVAATARQLAEIVEVALGNHVVRDRLTGTAVLDHEQAGLLDTLGYVARASGRAVDGRADHPFVDLPGFTPVVETGGDVLARLQVRAREAAASAALITDLTARLDDGSSDAAPVPEPAQASGTGCALAPGHGLGIVEAWRGLLVHRVEVGPDGRLTRVKVVDPSFVNWPALPVALTDVIVPDFPLANKSFNQSYAGNDL